MAKPRINELLARLELAKRADELVERYSSGMKQRIAIAKALLPKPPVLLLDEPTIGLDPQSARNLRELILEFKSEGHTILLTTHYMEEADQLCDRIGIIDQGKIIALDTPAALRSRLFGRRVSITLTGPALRFEPVVQAAGAHDIKIESDTISIAVEGEAPIAPVVVKALVDAGARIISVIPEERPLEEVYLRLLKDEGR